jgi:CubicO group peptidase (beta-lactamase class C family)
MSTPNQPELDAGRISAMNQALRQFIDRETLVGAVVLVAQRGRVVYAGAKGWANRETGVAMTRGTGFRLASLTKLLTSVAALRLCELGTLALDAPITRWLPGFRPRLPDGTTPDITLAQLLCHTAGFGYRFEMGLDNAYDRAGVSDGMDLSPVTAAEHLRRLASVPLLHAPGTAWRYSLATDVVGFILERATGQPLPTVIAECVTRPLGMHDTAFEPPPDLPLAQAYRDPRGVETRPARMDDDDWIDLPTGRLRLSTRRVHAHGMWLAGGVGMVGTADDYLKLLESLRMGAGPLLSPESTQLLLANALGALPVGERGPGWGFGLGPLVMTDPARAQQPQGAGTWSWCGVYGNHYWVDPQAGISFIALTNTGVAGAWGDFADSMISTLYSKRSKKIQC